MYSTAQTEWGCIINIEAKKDGRESKTEEARNAREIHALGWPDTRGCPLSLFGKRGWLQFGPCDLYLYEVLVQLFKF